MENNKNVIVPDYIKEAMKNDNKKYGTSVFDYIPDDDKTSEPNDFFKDSDFNSAEIEKEREELKKGYDGETIKEITAKDALSGISSSTPDASFREAYNDINKTVEASDIRGKTITKYGREILKSLLNDDPTEEELRLISSKFEEYSESLKEIDNENPSNIEVTHLEFSNMDIDTLESFLSKRIIDQLKNLCNDSGQYKGILSRLLEQIYKAYDNVLGYRDDIKELNDLAMEIDNTGILDNKEIDISDSKSIDYISDKITRYMEAMKRLDSRNSKMKQDYTINDIDTILFEDIKQCLDSAINFTKIKNKIDMATNKFRIDLKNKKECNKSIENWIHSIKHDQHTLFTFPCNDFLSDTESREELVRFFYNSYLVDIVSNNLIDVPVDVEIEDHLISNNVLTTKDINILKDKAYVMLYMISRTFKYNKMKDNNSNIRILSYTLDIISKLGVKSHRDKFIEASDYVYNKLYN